MTKFFVLPKDSSMQQPSSMPFYRYEPVKSVYLPDRGWPEKRILKAPRWLSTDLRDGNQALINPMAPKEKHQMFNLLIKLGYKEIEVGFPSASKADFEFVRQLIEQDLIPDDVVISVLTQARQDLIELSVKSIIGAKRATIHMYNATAELFRRVVFKMSAKECINLAKQGTAQVCEYADKYLADTEFGYQYSPEIFSQTPTDFAVEICNEVSKIWQPGPSREIIFNLPATVEKSTPNIYADQVEYFCRNINNREYVVVSLHPHNDRGSAVAAAELGQMAGADRVEGCLFGHGERTGNVDLLTLALNLYSQGIDPQLDFSDIDEVRRTVEHCTGIMVHPRHPYAGELVYTAFSGSHQDAINKGLIDLANKAEMRGQNIHSVNWEVPYLPIDPYDVGRSYEAIIRVNSQSGKGGIAYIMKSEYKLDLPRRLQIEFSNIVQRHTDNVGGEFSPEMIWQIFNKEYLNMTQYDLIGNTVSNANGRHKLTATIRKMNEINQISGEGNGPVSAFVDALGSKSFEIKILDYTEHALQRGRDAKAAAYIECDIKTAKNNQVLWGVGIDSDITRASFKAVLSALSRAI